MPVSGIGWPVMPRVEGDCLRQGPSRLKWGLAFKWCLVLDKISKITLFI
jgi:hypothetical protein